MVSGFSASLEGRRDVSQSAWPCPPLEPWASVHAWEDSDWEEADAWTQSEARSDLKLNIKSGTQGLETELLNYSSNIFHSCSPPYAYSYYEHTEGLCSWPAMTDAQGTNVKLSWKSSIW